MSNTTTRQNPLTLLQRHRVMCHVELAKADMPDAELAESAGALIGRAVSPQTIRDYRKAFGLPSVKSPTRQELEAKVRELQAKLEGVE